MYFLFIELEVCNGSAVCFFLASGQLLLKQWKISNFKQCYFSIIKYYSIIILN